MKLNRVIFLMMGILIISTLGVVDQSHFEYLDLLVNNSSSPHAEEHAAYNFEAKQSGNILLYTTRNYGTGLGSRRWDYDEDLPAILAQDGFSVTVEDRETVPELSTAILATYDQLWIVSTENGAILTSQEVQAIQDFHNAGKAIMVIGDGCSYTGPANQFSPTLGVQFVATQCCHCDHCGGSVSCPISTSGFVPHEIWNGVSAIEANLNEGDISASAPAQIIASHNSINMVAVRDADGGRVAWDATWYRFTDASCHPEISITHYDNAQYVRNLACWLVRCGESIPTLSEWGLIIFGVVLVGFVTYVFLKRRKVIGVRL